MVTVKRKLFFSERFMHLCGDKSCEPISMTFTISVKGNIPFERVRLTLDKLQEKHPSLRARVKGNYIFFEENGIPPIPLKIVERISDDTWKTEKEKFKTEPFNCEEGELLKVLWVRSEVISEFVFKGLHVILDWKSITVLINEFFVLLNNPNKEIQPYLPIKSLDEFMQGEALNFKQKILANLYFEQWRIKEFLNSFNKKRPPYELYHLHYRISKDLTEKLTQISEKNGVPSIGSFFCILALRIFKKHFQPERTKRFAHITIDSRRFFPSVKKDWLFQASSLIFPRIQIYDETDIWEQARDFSEMLFERAYKMQVDKNHPIYKSGAHSVSYSFRKTVLVSEYIHRFIKSFTKLRLCVDEGHDFTFDNLGEQLPLPKNTEFEMNDIFPVEVTMPWFNSTIFGFGYDYEGKIYFFFTANEYHIPREKMNTIASEFLTTLEELAKNVN